MAKRKKKSAMTASTLSQLPIMVGSVLIDNVSRAGSWALSHYKRAPLASTGLLAMVTLTALAGSNALYFQTTTHPSPFFVPARAEVAILPTPAADRPLGESEAVSVLPEGAVVLATGERSPHQLGRFMAPRHDRRLRGIAHSDERRYPLPLRQADLRGDLFVVEDPHDAGADA